MVSQLLLRDLALRPLKVEQRFRSLATGADHVADLPAWRELMRGAIPGPNQLGPEPRYPHSERDLAEACRRDLGYQAFFCAGSTLLAWGTPIDGGNPYKHSRTQTGFATWGSMSMLNLLGLASDAAFAACWYEKWRVHRRLRPEEYAGRFELTRSEGLDLPFPESLRESAALDRLQSANGSVLLPQAYAEGCPLHPSYPAGHAVVAGACATVLKAFFAESWVVPEPVVPSVDGRTLERWRGADLAVGAEIDKLASAMAVGRNWAGIHWWSDTAAGLDLGERVATAVLAEVRERMPEQLGELSFVGFDGRRRVV
jgi:membrane-associated phospholipid phosphatase